ncbi:META domain-containing protein [Thalassobellus citreus]|uniref:META domain-containing protein n=1 Tax=Thalassobellus citreus TaxID=3367752 RepID=UPI003799475D
MKFTTILLALFMLQSCKCQKETTSMLNNSSQEKQTEVLSGAYSISLIGTNKNLPEKLNIFFEENTNKVSGFAGCNRFSGTYTTKANTITFSKLITTRMYCENVMDIEKHLLKTLSDANIFSIKKGQLNLKKDNVILVEASKSPLNTIQTKNSYIIEYTASSRGVFKHIIINKKNISIASKRGGKPTIKEYNEAYWNSLLETIKTLNIESISTLEAPSKKFQFDGAPLAHLKITKGEVTYESSPFDHGNPPIEIETLVKEILSISENIE